MRNARDRNGIDRDEGGNATANAHKSAKGLQMSDPNGNDVAGMQLFDIAFHTFFLHLPPGKNCHRLSICSPVKTLDAKTHSFVDAGDQGDIFGRTVLDSNGAFLFGNNSFHAD